MSCKPSKLEAGVVLEDRPGCESVYDRGELGRLSPEDGKNACKGDLSDCIAKCKANNMFSCATLAVRYLHGNGVPKDTAKGLALASLACRAGQADACVLSGMAHAALVSDLGAEAGQEHVCRAFYDYADGCKLGDINACDAVRTVPNDYLNPTEALEVRAATREVTRQCVDHGRADACLLCSYRHFDEDPARTQLYEIRGDVECLKRACKMGDSSSCVGAIVSMAERARWGEDGAHVTATAGGYAEAKRRITKLCDGGNRTACAYQGFVDELLQEQVDASRREQAHAAKADAADRRRAATYARETDESLTSAGAALARWKNRHREAARRAREAQSHGGAGGLNARDKAILDNINKGPSLDTGCAGGYFYSHDVGNAIRTGFRCP